MELSPEARRQVQQMIDGFETNVTERIKGLILGEGTPIIIRAHYDEIANHKVLLSGQEQYINYLARYQPQVTTALQAAVVNYINLHNLTSPITVCTAQQPQAAPLECQPGSASTTTSRSKHATGAQHTCPRISIHTGLHSRSPTGQSRASSRCARQERLT